MPSEAGIIVPVSIRVLGSQFEPAGRGSAASAPGAKATQYANEGGGAADGAPAPAATINLCGPADDRAPSFRSDLPEAGPGVYQLSAALTVSTDTGPVLVTGPSASATLR